MIRAIESLERNKAVGILARAALSLSYASAPIVSEEDRIGIEVISEVRDRLGIAPDDNSSDAIERIADTLDAESDQLISIDTKSALERLAERGDLPSDLYEINIIKNVHDIYGKEFGLEKDVIETAIRGPHGEQHFGPARSAHEPAMISLFVRHFRTKWPLKDFFMLVAAARDGFRLDVHQAWRIYPSTVNVVGAQTPLELLRRFSDKFGADIEIAGQKGHFFVFLNGPIPNQVKWSLKPKQKIIVSRFAQHAPGSNLERSALVVAINIEQYRAVLRVMRVRRQDIIDKFIPAPAARD